ncbi:hypothetical protein GP486_002113 [Trichoglossum hirsutum]|uniref:Large ribosomal subunit protein mL59 domain-containing protein n=1 Tax=Trichoglossum hirsutum TaxID=265104 RepID=A0A9P8LFU5_9PEZI|nr:hypothetical protein GP486_002113 [Trichoglossum hirsutum]
MATQRQYVKLAQSLPPRLLRFFARYPPPALLQTAKPSLTATDSVPPTTTNEPPPDAITATEDATSAYANPFQAQRCPHTGKWHSPVFSLRRQAELVKLARKHGVEELLPYTVKGTEEKLRRREERGLRVRGTGIGQKVKGKAWERTLKERILDACDLLLGFWMCLRSGSLVKHGEMLHARSAD